MMYHRLTVNQSLSPIKDEPQDADETTQLFVYQIHRIQLNLNEQNLSHSHKTKSTTVVESQDNKIGFNKSDKITDLIMSLNK